MLLQPVQVVGVDVVGEVVGGRLDGIEARSAARSTKPNRSIVFLGPVR